MNPPTTAGLKPGMAVKDRSGAIIGTISEVGVTSGGRPMAQVLVDGRQILTPAANLSSANNGAFAATPLSKAQLLATAVR